MPRIYSNINLNSQRNSASKGFYFGNNRRKSNFNRKSSLFNFSKFFNFIDRFGSLNSFYFQIIGITMLTFAIILTFFSIFDFTTTKTIASDSDGNVKILTNFQGDEYTRSSSPKLVEIKPPEPEAEKIEAKPKYYTVKEGDSLSSMSAELGVDMQVLVDINELEDPKNLTVGQEILIP